MGFGNKSGDSIEIIERDGTSRKISTWKFDCANLKLANNIMGYLIQKYGFSPVIRQSKDDFLQQDMNL